MGDMHTQIVTMIVFRVITFKTVGHYFQISYFILWVHRNNKPRTKAGYSKSLMIVPLGNYDVGKLLSDEHLYSLYPIH